MDAFGRTRLLIGEENLEKLKKSSVALFGAGGVGGFAAEALARSGVGSITVFDNDTVKESNLNRQIVATAYNIGTDKTEAIKARLKSINPDIKVHCEKVFYLPENADKYDLSGFDYILDAVDTVSAKITLAVKANSLGVPIISSMGTGGKLNPLLLSVGDVFETEGCPLARVMRRELKKAGVNKLKVVWSPEKPIKADPRISDAEENDGRKLLQPSMIFVPACAGIIMANEAIKHIISK